MMYISQKKWNSLVPVLLFISCGIFSSCHYAIVRADRVFPGGNERETTLYTSYYPSMWARANSKVALPNVCHGNGLYRVTVHSGIWDVLLSTVTFGLVIPIHVDWTCAKASQVVGGGVPVNEITGTDSAVFHNWVWGLQDPEIAVAPHNRKGLHKITIELNDEDILYSIQTLGFYVPIKIRWALP